MTIATLGGVRSTSSGHPLHDQDTAKHAAPRARRNRAKSTLFAVAGIAGLLSILWLIAALVFGLSIIVFKTGSMAPTMPTGSAAVTRSIPASEIRVGDVVTVPVPGKTLPVTHRVYSVKPYAAVPGDRILVLKGDDNLTPDQIPYTVGRVKLVIFAVPGAGTALAILQTAPFVGVATLLVASLLFWAFWPSGGSATPTRPSRRTTSERPQLSQGTKPRTQPLKRSAPNGSGVHDSLPCWCCPA
jgi:signal peptidase